ncbi:MAG: hypothetical protein JSW11_15120 [Candidatus Heimdallarchaeota archaeon]|nr:MAG: hypothetical protein JSW11_15120 [Candidatus Heimdallarchaeota archaeon]
MWGKNSEEVLYCVSCGSELPKARSSPVTSVYDLMMTMPWWVALLLGGFFWFACIISLFGGLGLDAVVICAFGGVLFICLGVRNLKRRLVIQAGNNVE